MKRVSQLAAAVALATASLAASAADIQVNYSVNYGDTLSTSTAFDGGFFNVNGTIGGGNALEYQLHLTNGKSFAAYCIDPLLSNGSNGAKYNLSTQALDSIARLFAVSGFNGKAYGTDGVNTGVKATALALAIWEVTYDGLSSSLYGATDLNLASTDNDGTASWLNMSTGGSFRAGGFSYDAVSQAAAYLNAAKGLTVGSYVPTVQVLVPTEAGYQRMVTSVPEPSTYALLAACLGVIGLVMRRKSV